VGERLPDQLALAASSQLVAVAGIITRLAGIATVAVSLIMR
jgi:hypothetical protein